MKKYINNKLYDTATAKAIGTKESDDPTDRLFSSTATLYRKKTGEFFLYGSGGAGSLYGKNRGGDRVPGEEIIPFPYETARRWAEQNLTADEYEAAFAVDQDDDSRAPLTLSVTAGWLSQLRTAAAKAGVPISAYIMQNLPL